MNTTLPDEAATKKRPIRAAHVLASATTVCAPILLLMLTSFLTDQIAGERTIGLICGYWLFRAFRDHVYQLGDLLEKRLGRSIPEDAQEPALGSNPDAVHWPRVGVNVFVFMGVCLITTIAVRGIQHLGSNEKPKQITADFLRSQATAVYWQSAVANLHAVRFQTPAGQEPAEKYYERIVQQLRLGTDAAKSASTVNVDPELAQMVSKHLAVDNEFLQLKRELDEFMRRQQLPAPTDTIDQRMAISQSLLGIAQANPEVLEKMTTGAERDWIEKGLVLERLREDQFREIEIMQAVLRERYKGAAFPLPAIK